MTTQENANASCSRKQTCRAMPMTNRNQGVTILDKFGFTLVELIVVTAIIAILATMAVPAYTEMSLRAKNANAKSDIRTLELAVNAYVLDRNYLPAQLTDIGAQASIRDPWKHPYQYYNIGTGTGDPGPRYTGWNAVEPNLNEDFDLYSMGPDGVTAHNILDPTKPKNDSSDDIVRTGSGSTVELATEY
jgi:type II secretion system protein G